MTDTRRRQTTSGHYRYSSTARQATPGPLWRPPECAFQAAGRGFKSCQAQQVKALLSPRLIQQGSQWSRPRLVTQAMGRRRGQGEDSIYWDSSKNRYVGAASQGFSPAGRRIRRKVTGRTRAEVRDKLRELHLQAGSRLLQAWPRQQLVRPSSVKRRLPAGSPSMTPVGCVSCTDLGTGRPPGAPFVPKPTLFVVALRSANRLSSTNLCRLN